MMKAINKTSVKCFLARASNLPHQNVSRFHSQLTSLGVSGALEPISRIELICNHKRSLVDRLQRGVTKNNGLQKVPCSGPLRLVGRSYWYHSDAEGFCLGCN